MIVRDYSILSSLVTCLKKEGNIVGFTNGVFDILHTGHIFLLKEAKKHCDILVVAINSDASTKRIKDPRRPILSEEERANILNAVRYVDLVTVMQEDDPTSLLMLLRPHVFFKGGQEYKDISKYPEGPLLRKLGIRYVWIDTPSIHTTDIIRTIVERYG